MTNNERINELLSIVEKKDKSMAILLEPYLNDLIQLETSLFELRKLPHFKINPNDETQQKVLPMGKLYRDTFSLYATSMKTIITLMSSISSDEINPMMALFKEMSEKMRQDASDEYEE